MKKEERGVNSNVKKEWLKETCRDFIALGSIPFFILVLVRVYILNNPGYFYQFLFAGILVILLSFLFRINLYSGLGLIMVFFLSMHYEEAKFSIFAVIAYLILIFSLYYLGKDKKEIIKGVFFGGICTGVSYYLVNLFF